MEQIDGVKQFGLWFLRNFKFPLNEFGPTLATERLRNRQPSYFSLGRRMGMPSSGCLQEQPWSIGVETRFFTNELFVDLGQVKPRVRVTCLSKVRERRVRLFRRLSPIEGVRQS